MYKLYPIATLICLLMACQTEKPSSTGVYYRDFDWIKMQGVSPIKDKDSLTQFNTLVYIEYDSVQQIKQAKFSINHYGERVLNRLGEGTWETDLFTYPDIYGVCGVFKSTWSIKRQDTMFICTQIEHLGTFENGLIKAYQVKDTIYADYINTVNRDIRKQKERYVLDRFLEQTYMQRRVKFTRHDERTVSMQTIEYFEKPPYVTNYYPSKTYYNDLFTIDEDDAPTYYLFILRIMNPCY
jgi:hypothetical protein